MIDQDKSHDWNTKNKLNLMKHMKKKQRLKGNSVYIKFFFENILLIFTIVQI